MVFDALNDCISGVAKQLCRQSISCSDNSINGSGFKAKVAKLISLLQAAMFPKIYTETTPDAETHFAYTSNYLHQAAIVLYGLCRDVLSADDPRDPEAIVTAFIQSIAEIADVLESDICAAYAGDPAARSGEEIMLAYPSFEAVSIYRLAHSLFTLGVPLLPRMMTEYAHQRTGIDIHPGAQIGRSFFIDHGTGVVIGETCVIGDRVKLYQGVTLGAKSFELDENGNPVKNIKRHPNIGNDVIIYANATILGGDTYIGDNCVIGGNTWLTHSVEAGSTVNNDGRVYKTRCKAGMQCENCPSKR